MISLCGRACQTVERAINGYRSRLAVTSWPTYAVEAMEVRLLLDAAPVDSDRTFGHPLEDNGTKNLTLATGEYTLEVDADPNGNHFVDWYTTPSGTGGPQDTAGFYYYDNHDFSFAPGGSYWVRAEVYSSDLFSNRLGFEAQYRWNVTIPAVSYVGVIDRPANMGSDPAALCGL